MEGNNTSSTASKNNMMPLVIGAILLILVAGVIFVAASKKQPTTTIQPTSAMLEQPTTAQPTDSTPSTPTSKMEEKAGTKTFTVEASSFMFSPKELRVKKGDTVKVTVTNKAGFHDWVLDEFNVRTKQLAAGQSDTVEFVADKAGTFEYYCSVGNHRQMGMVGKLIVE